MRIFGSGCIGRVRRAAKEDNGSVTVEMAMWMPMFAIVIAAVADTSMLLYSQARLLDVARDASRQVSLGRLGIDEANEMIKARMAWAASYDALVFEDGDFVTTRMSVPFAAVTVFGDALFSNKSLTTEFTMLREAPPAEVEDAEALL